MGARIDGDRNSDPMVRAEYGCWSRADARSKLYFRRISKLCAAASGVHSNANSVGHVAGACQDTALVNTRLSWAGISPSGGQHGCGMTISRGWVRSTRAGLWGAMASGETGWVDLMGTGRDGKVGCGLVDSVASGKTG